MSERIANDSPSETRERPGRPTFHAGTDVLASRNPIRSIAWSPDDQGFAILDLAGEVRWISQRSGVDGRLATGFSYTAIATNSRGQVVLGRQDGVIQIWTRGGQEGLPGLAVLAGLRSSIDALSCADDGVFVSLDVDHCVRIHRPGSRRPAIFDDVHSAQSVAISPDGKHVVIGRTTGEIELLDVNEGQRIGNPILVGAAVTALQFAGLDRPAICLTDKRIASLVRFGDDQETQPVVIGLAEGPVVSIGLSRDGRTAVTGHEGGRVNSWDADGKPGPEIPRRHKRDVTAVAVSATGTDIITGDSSGESWTFYLNSSRAHISPVGVLPPHRRGARNIQFALGGRWIVTDGLDARTIVRNIETGETSHTFGPYPGNTAFAVDPGGQRIAIGDSRKAIKLIDLLTGKELAEIDGLPTAPYCLAFSPDGRRLAAAFRNEGAQIFDLTDDRSSPLVIPPDPRLPFIWVEFSPDGKQLASCTGDYNQEQIPGLVRLHDVATGEVALTLNDYTSEVKAASFNSDGSRLVTTCKDRIIRIYALPSGTLKHSLKMADMPNSVAFVPRSNLMLVGDARGVVHMMNIETGDVIQKVSCHTDLVTRLTLSSDLSTLATTSRDGTAKLWQLIGDKDHLSVVSTGGLDN